MSPDNPSQWLLVRYEEKITLPLATTDLTQFVSVTANQQFAINSNSTPQ